jgi:hypothetical protein
MRYFLVSGYGWLVGLFLVKDYPHSAMTRRR